MEMEPGTKKEGGTLFTKVLHYKYDISIGHLECEAVANWIVLDYTKKSRTRKTGRHTLENIT